MYKYLNTYKYKYKYLYLSLLMSVLASIALDMHYHTVSRMHSRPDKWKKFKRGHRKIRVVSLTVLPSLY